MDNDPLYEQGLKHFGLGEWTQAAACFSQLQVNYPDEPRVTQFLETARLRAEATPGLQQGIQARTRASWLTRLSRVGVLLVILAVVGTVYLAYQNWVVPAQAENARLAHIDEMRRLAVTQLASGQYADAAQTYQQILNEVPGDVEANSGLARTQQLQQIADLYAQATQAMNAGDNAGATRLLEQISQLDPNYRDTNSLLGQIKSTQALIADYDSAMQLYDAKKWQAAAQAFETIRSTDRNFKPQEIVQYLYDSYVQLGDGQLKQADTVPAVELAAGYYQRALTVRPLDPRASSAQQMAGTFLDGATAYQAKDWETVIRKLSLVHDEEPDYFGGKVTEWLFEAFISTGDAFMSKGDPFSARDRYAEAVRLAQTDAQKADAQKRYDTANRLTTPTPTPKPSPTPLPAGWVAPSWTLRPTGTPNPYPFIMISMTYLPNTITGSGCEWAGVAGRIFDRKGAPLIADTLGVRLTGPVDVGAAAGSAKIMGESGWIIQYDVHAKVTDGYIQVYYKDQPASDLIPYQTRKSCYENMLIIDIQQVKPLPK